MSTISHITPNELRELQFHGWTEVKDDTRTPIRSAEHTANKSREFQRSIPCCKSTSKLLFIPS